MVPQRMAKRLGSGAVADKPLFHPSPLHVASAQVRRYWSRLCSAVSHPGVRNAGWIGVEKIGRMSLSLLVGVFVVRQLGPDRYGTYSYIAAWAAIFSPLALFGIGENTVRHLVGSPAHEGRVLATAAILRVGSSLAAMLLTIGAFVVAGGHAEATTAQLGLALTGLAAYPMLVLEPYFQAHSKARIITICGLGSALAVAAVKIVGIVTAAPVGFFLAAHSLETGLLGVSLLAAYFATASVPRQWAFDIGLAKTLCREALPMIIGGFAVLIYNQSDMLLLGMLLDSPHQLGLYSAACRVSTMWVFIPMAVITSASPFLYRLLAGNDSRYEKRLLQMMSVCLAIAYGFCLVVAIFPESILRLLFGEDFVAAAPALRVHVWSNIFSILGMAQNSWILGRGLLWVALQNTILGAAINLGLNVFVIPAHGAVGAACTTVVAMAAATIVAMAIRPETRGLARVHLRALALCGLSTTPSPTGLDSGLNGDESHIL
jgi:PST family polysaccharide transporter